MPLIKDMASRSCAICLRTLVHQSPHSRLCTSLTACRDFTSSKPQSSETSSYTLVPKMPSSSQPQGGKEPPKITETPKSRLLSLFQRSPQLQTSSTYTAYVATEALYDLCKSQADYKIPQAADKDAEMPKTDSGEDLGVGKGWWLNEMGLKPTFGTWSHVTMFHMYFFLVRLRCFPADDSLLWQRSLLNHFFYDAEDRMLLNHRMHSRTIRNKHLKDLLLQWRGCIAAYDEGLVRGDTFLAAAIWRNVFKADEEIDVGKLGLSVSYMRRFLQTLDRSSDLKIMTADVELIHPREEGTLVGLKSKMMSRPFDVVVDKDGPLPKRLSEQTT